MFWRLFRGPRACSATAPWWRARCRPLLPAAAFGKPHTTYRAGRRLSVPTQQLNLHIIVAVELQSELASSVAAVTWLRAFLHLLLTAALPPPRPPQPLPPAFFGCQHSSFNGPAESGMAPVLVVTVKQFGEVNANLASCARCVPRTMGPCNGRKCRARACVRRAADSACCCVSLQTPFSGHAKAVVVLSPVAPRVDHQSSTVADPAPTR